MICKEIELSHFRNAEQERVTFSSGVNVLAGDNAQGKTNLLEAIYFASIGKSFRVIHDSDMIAFGREGATVSLTYHDGVRDQNITIKLFRDKKKYAEHNRVKITRMSELVGCFRAVLFCPENLSLIKEGPSLRRGYLDVAISQLRPRYLHALQTYGNVLKQRNKLIKDAAEDRRTYRDTIEFWNEQLAREAAILTEYRYWYIQKAEEHIRKCFLDMTGEAEEPGLTYISSSKETGETLCDRELVEKKYRKLLEDASEREILAGTTLYGIHKDDIDILINGKSARHYGSQGQQRSLALAMKLSEGEICREEYGEYPVFLFDDVLSELDVHRREYLLAKMQGKQVIMTSCEADNGTSAHIIQVAGGHYVPMGG